MAKQLSRTISVASTMSADSEELNSMNIPDDIIAQDLFNNNQVIANLFLITWFDDVRYFQIRISNISDSAINLFISKCKCLWNQRLSSLKLVLHEGYLSFQFVAFYSFFDFWCL